MQEYSIYENKEDKEINDIFGLNHNKNELIYSQNC